MLTIGSSKSLSTGRGSLAATVDVQLRGSSRQLLDVEHPSDHSILNAACVSLAV